MNGFDFLNLVIGLIFIYLIYSIAASMVWEIIVSVINLKGRMLQNWISDNFSKLTSEMTEDEKKAEREKGNWKKFIDKLFGKKGKNQILNHPLVQGLSLKKDKLPNYISSKIFADVLTDLVVNKEKTSFKEIDINSFKNNLKNSNLEPELQRVFLQFISESSGNIKKVKERISEWYDEVQERLIGSFKKRLQLWIFMIALVLVTVTNADTFRIATYLYNNPEARNAISLKVDQLVQDSIFLTSKIYQIDKSKLDSITRLKQDELIKNAEKKLTELEELNSDFSELQLPLGWDDASLKSLKSWGFLKKVGGLFITIFAVSLGSPFWFDILSKLANLRSSGNKPKTTEKESAN